jgi:hypothetical protein
MVGLLTAFAVLAGCSGGASRQTARPPTSLANATSTPTTGWSAPPTTAGPLPRSVRLSGPPCTAPPGRSLLVTVDCVDPTFRSAVVDVDEQRSITEPGSGRTLHYRYVHGGFAGTTAKFALYYPAPKQYKGRFFESTYPTVMTEDADPGAIVLALANGAYAVSTNNGLGVMNSPATGGYRVNASAAKLSRQIAKRLYGANAPVRGYLYGASGGAYQTIGTAPRTRTGSGTAPSRSCRVSPTRFPAS